MLLIAQFAQFGLALEGYSFQTSELDVVPRVLQRHDIPFQEISIDRTGRIERYEPPFQRPPDFAHISKFPRLGRVWTISMDAVNRLEVSLNLVFVRYGQETFAFPAGGGGQRFCCREIGLAGDGDGRENIEAADEDEALFKCALVAGRKHWFGGVAKPGRCGLWVKAPWR